MARRICVVTGTRAEYGLLRPIMRVISGAPGLDLKVVAAGMHLVRRFGRTVDEIIADGFTIDARVPMTPREDGPAAMAASVGRGIRGFARAFADLRPDVVLVLGDRVEAFAAATAAAISNIFVAHVHGGDRAEAGHDDSMRHAITKMAHLHFAATRQSARRLARLGERQDRIWIAGAPGLDEIRTARLPTRQTLCRRYGLDARVPFLLVVQHPVSTQPDRAADEMAATLGAVRSVGLPALIIYPNADAGGRRMIEVIKRFAAGEKGVGSRLPVGASGASHKRLPTPFLRMMMMPSVPHLDYLGLLKHAAVLVGNSSSGIIEAPTFKTPVVNVGRRQAGRERAANVIDVAPDEREVAAGIRRALTDGAFRRRLARCRNPYGTGYAAQRIAHVLTHVPLDDDLRRKRITY